METTGQHLLWTLDYYYSAEPEEREAIDDFVRNLTDEVIESIEELPSEQASLYVYKYLSELYQL
ncbi:MAG: hypothetical protein KatS3mg101_1142 [Patescibacteria group bacterium]|nr:MAG: hypothetical protein KatS3mg101_1142 [Patescibacteria group bacterium]